MSPLATTGLFAWALLGGVLAAATLRALDRLVSYRSGGRGVIFLLAWAFAPVAVVGARTHCLRGWASSGCFNP